LYDLAEWVRAHAELAAYLTDTPTAQLAAQLGNGETPPGVDADDWRDSKSCKLIDRRY